MPQDLAPQPLPAVTIATVEREVGLPKDTLRIWERRYGFPKPERNATGDRLYPGDQIERLRLVKRLVDAGHRPSRVAALATPQLLALCAADSNRQPLHAAAEELRWCTGLLKQHQLDELRQALRRSLTRMGLARFVTELLAPFIAELGDAWTRGELEIFEEHLLTHDIRLILREAIDQGAPQSPAGRPRVLLTTLPGEVHGMGLAMVEALLAREGATCLCLGTQTPVRDIARACAELEIDLVGLSTTACMNGQQLLAWLNELRRSLPAHVHLWVGGGAPVLHRRRIEGVEVFSDLHGVAAKVQQWRGGARLAAAGSGNGAAPAPAS
jgi:DNA-binding transcriptional MerR regulator/methylmalonyl-CoA mutase cobalamin-binding subunit